MRAVGFRLSAVGRKEGEDSPRWAAELKQALVDEKHRIDLLVEDSVIVDLKWAARIDPPLCGSPRPSAVSSSERETG